MESGAQPWDWRERDWEHEALSAEHDRLKIEGPPLGMSWVGSATSRGDAPPTIRSNQTEPAGLV